MERQGVTAAKGGLAFNPNLLAQAAAVAALGDQGHIRKTVELNREGLAQMTAAYTDMGLEYIPSVGNFLTVKVGDAKAVNQDPAYRGLLEIERATETRAA